MGNRRTDLIGQRFGRLTVVEKIGIREVYGRNKTVWKCICDCGNVVELETSRLDGKRVRSCGCLLTDFNFKHGMTGTKEHNTWLDMRRRVLDKSRPDYELYKDLELYEEWKTDFLSFYEEIGPCPFPQNDYSLDRKNTHLGYIPGNVRWAKDFVQARNASMHKNNKTGVNGVCVVQTRGKSYIQAFIRMDGKVVRKTYSLNKYSYEDAIRMATEWRKAKEKEIGQASVSFSEQHGKWRPSRERVIKK